MLKVTKSNPVKPVRLMIFGQEGVGKSSLGARSDNPIFITPEGGVDQLSTEYLQGMDTWDAVSNAIEALKEERHDYKTLVLDSADWLEKLCHQKIGAGKDIIRAVGGYGAGYREAERMHSMLIGSLSELRDKKGMNIIITAHAHVKQVKDPSAMEDYDQHEPKMHSFVSSLWREWVDALIFVRFRTFTKSDDTQKARAFSDGSRVAYTVKQPSFEAKNRYGLPPEMDFTLDFWGEFMKHARKGIQPRKASEVKTEINELVPKLNQDTQEKVLATMKGAGNDVAKLESILSRVKEILK